MIHFINPNPNPGWQPQNYLACGVHIGDFVASRVQEKVTCKNCKRTRVFSKAQLAIVATCVKTLKKPQNHYIKQNVSIDIAEIIYKDHEGFLDLLSELTVNNTLLMDISWRLISTDPTNSDCIILEVIGDPTESDRF